jgi:hypothetical protein
VTVIISLSVETALKIKPWHWKKLEDPAVSMGCYEGLDTGLYDTLQIKSDGRLS